MDTTSHMCFVSNESYSCFHPQPTTEPSEAPVLCKLQRPRCPFAPATMVKKKKSLSSSASACNTSTEKMLLLKSSKESKRMGQQTRLSGVAKRRTSGRKPAKQKKRKEKIDAKKPKKPPTAFFYFLEDFRKEFQEKNPDIKSMRDIGKACGEKWKTMTYEEKVQYYDIATEKRAEFDRAMAEYNKRKETGEDEETTEDTEYDE